MTAKTARNSVQLHVSGQVPPSRLSFRILATTDLHGHIQPWDDFADRPAPARGLAQLATLISQARAEVSQSILLDNGDFLNGSPLSDHVAEARRVTRKALHPMIAAMNLLAYDAATLGNHEFSMGLPYLRTCLRGARFPIVSSNLYRTNSARRRPIAPRHILLRRVFQDDAGNKQPVIIGVLGFLPPQTIQWERRHLQGTLDAEDILSSASVCAQRLRRAGADVVIALSHSGLGAGSVALGCENVSCALSRIEGIDAVIAGHTHQTFPLTPLGNGVGAQSHPPCESGAAPIVMPGFFGSHLGVIDLALGHDGTGWQVLGHQTELRPVARRSGPEGRIEAMVPAAPEVIAVCLDDQASMQARSRLTVGRTTAPLHSYFAMAGHSAVQDLLANAQLDLARDLLQGKPEAALPLLVAVAPFKAGGRGGPENYIDIAAGALTTRHVSDLYIHPNSPTLLCLSGAEVALWLERAASLFHQVPAGARDAPLLNPEFPSYNFDMIHGLTFQIDLTQPAMFDANGTVAVPGVRRISALLHAGRPVAPEARFVVASNSYRASGGAGFAGADAAHTVVEDPRALRHAVEAHLRAKGTVTPKARADWHFAPLPGTTVIFDSSPRAARLATEFGLEPLDTQPSGFLRFRLRL